MFKSLYKSHQMTFFQFFKHNSGRWNIYFSTGHFTNIETIFPLHRLSVIDPGDIQDVWDHAED